MMSKETFESLIARMEAAADNTGNALAFWQQVAWVLRVWSDAKDGWVPVVHFDPRYNAGLRDLETAFKRFGASLFTAANERAFA